GYPNYTVDGINNLIPELFASEAREKFYASTCLNQICYTNVIGASELKQQGDRIIIPTVGNVTVKRYSKGQPIEREFVESPSIEMTVDEAAYFNFAVDKIDLKQFKIKNW